MINLILQALASDDVLVLSESVKKLAELQHNQGSEWSVNGAAFIITSLFVIVILGIVFGFLVRSMLNQQKQLTQKVLYSTDLLQKFQISFDKNTQVLDRVNTYLQKIDSINEEKAKLEATQSQLQCFIKASLDAFKFKVSSNVSRIIRENNIMKKKTSDIK